MRPLYSLLLPLVIPDEAFPSSGGIVHKYEFLVPLFHGLHCSGCIYEITGFRIVYGFSDPDSVWVILVADARFIREPHSSKLSAVLPGELHPVPVSEWISDFVVGEGLGCFSFGAVGVGYNLC